MSSFEKQHALSTNVTHHLSGIICWVNSCLAYKDVEKLLRTYFDLNVKLDPSQMRDPKKLLDLETDENFGVSLKSPMLEMLKQDIINHVQETMSSTSEGRKKKTSLLKKLTSRFSKTAVEVVP